MSRVLVLGAGIAGVTTAWYLAAVGAAVTVLERGSEPAAETSHANGCHLSTQSGTPWMGPAGVREFLATRWGRDRPVRILRAHDPGRWRWFAGALGASLPARHTRASAAISRLARFSRDSLEALLAELGLDIAYENEGVLSLYRTRRALARACRRRGADTEVLDAADLLQREPALAAAAVRPVGAIFYPGDATGDCRAFCVGLAERAAAAGVEFRYGIEARELIVEGGHFRGVIAGGVRLEADHGVVALGVDAAPLLRRYGLRLPILPLRGYTLSVPIVAGAPAPGRFVDAERRIVCARLGSVFRIAGMADFAGRDAQAPTTRMRALERVAADWYPALARSTLQHWTCLRPMTPDGPPVLGRSPIAGLWLNAGHGPLGWTLGCGAGRIVAELVMGRPAPIPLAGLGAERFA